MRRDALSPQQEKAKVNLSDSFVETYGTILLRAIGNALSFDKTFKKLLRVVFNISYKCRNNEIRLLKNSRITVLTRFLTLTRTREMSDVFLLVLD